MHTKNPLDLGKKQQYYDHVRRDAIEFIRDNRITASRVIELGCSSGATGEQIKAIVGATQYVGVERFKEAAERASGRLDRVCVADLDAAHPVDLGFDDEPFDLLVTLDVLEHLYDPWSVLAEWGGLIAPGGRLVASIPNIQNIAVIARLADGFFDYESEGLLDSTHIRFFTGRSIENLLDGAGFAVEEVRSILNQPVDFTQVQPTGNSINVGRIQIGDLTRDQLVQICTFQYLVIGRKR